MEKFTGKLLAQIVIAALAVIIGIRFYQSHEIVVVANSNVLGDPNAKVTMTIFGDYQCPYCELQFKQSEQKVRDEYVAAGKVKMVFRDYPLDAIHPAARPAAIAARCAGKQGKFWEYHDALYESQPKLETLDFVSVAKSLKLDTDAFSLCLKDPAIDAAISKDIADGDKLGVTGTPANFINDTFLSGAYPYAQVKKAIDAELAKAAR